ncbi:MAG: hypothetical protein IPK16_27870 [Anaerolineales bacterium]|nr:hypothetical protein [Anaerolineales bacterium]
MRPEQSRASLQLGFMFTLMVVLFSVGLGCFCYPPPPTGGDFNNPEQALRTYDILAGPGQVTRYQGLGNAGLETSQGESEAINQAIPSTFFGLLIPTAPGAEQPGQLVGDQYAPRASYAISGTLEPVELKQDPAKAAILDEIYPPPAGSQWAALVFSDTHALDGVLNKAIETQNFGLTFNYTIDFFGADPCNGCAIQTTGCAPSGMGALFPADTVGSSSEVVCTKPFPSYITLTSSGKPLPGAPVVAAFSLVGYIPTTATLGGGVTQPVILQQTGATTPTFDLFPITSALGWTYAWQDINGAPISQIEVPPYDAWAALSPNLLASGSGVPTCTQVIDVVTLDASAEKAATEGMLAPVQAHTQANIIVLPDAANCPVFDVAVRQAQETSVILSGNRMTYTLTISNLTASTVNGVIQQTVTPTRAVSSAALPTGCTIAANIVTCNVDDIPAQGATSVSFAILGVPGYKGQLFSNVVASPAGAADANFLDNVSGPLVATVNFTQPTGLPDGEEPGFGNHLFMPGLNR